MPEIDEFDVTQLSDLDTLSGSLAERVYVSMREAILSLALPPNAVIRKNEICDQLGVSRSPVSQAIIRLESEGLVNVIPQSATRVSNISMTEIREGAFLRESLELAAVSLVASQRTDEQLAQLSRSLRMQILLMEDKDYAGFYDEDEVFHLSILEYTGYKKMVTVAKSAWLQVDRARRLFLPTPGRVQESIDEHQSIVRAIDKQDPDAARQAMKQHLSQLVNRIEPLQSQQPELFKNE